MGAAVGRMLLGMVVVRVRMGAGFGRWSRRGSRAGTSAQIQPPTRQRPEWFAQSKPCANHSGRISEPWSVSGDGFPGEPVVWNWGRRAPRASRGVSAAPIPNNHAAKPPSAPAPNSLPVLPALATVPYASLTRRPHSGVRGGDPPGRRRHLLPFSLSCFRIFAHFPSNRRAAGRSGLRRTSRPRTPGGTGPGRPGRSRGGRRGGPGYPGF